jgi:hypothetical protein
MRSRGFHSAMRTRPVRLAETASMAAEHILRRQPAPHRLVSHGEIREYHTQRRWWARRLLLVLMVFVVAGPVNHGFYLAMVKHRVVTISPAVAQAVEGTTLPYRAAWVVAANSNFPPLIGCMRGLDSVLNRVQRACEHVVLVAQGKRLPLRLASEWLVFVLPLLLLSGYLLSPGPVWWGFRLCAIELMVWAYASMECLYAPLVWLVDRSHTAREFYEAYYDGMEWID